MEILVESTILTGSLLFRVSHRQIFNFDIKFLKIQRKLLKLYQFRELSEILIEQRKLTFSMEKMAVFTQTVIVTSLMYGY